MKNLILALACWMSCQVTAATIESYVSLANGAMGSFQSGNLVAASLFSSAEQSVLILTGKTQSNEHALCRSIGSLADLAALETLIQTSPDAQINCQNDRDKSGTTFTKAFSVLTPPFGR
jgi:hypothetical protein